MKPCTNNSNITLTFAMLILALASCSSKEAEKDESIGFANMQGKFSAITLNEAGPGGALSFWSVKNYELIIDKQIPPLGKEGSSYFINGTDTLSSYYPFLLLKYPSQHLDLFFLIGSGQTNSFILSVFKNNQKVDQIDIWAIGGFKNLEDLSDKVTVQKRVEEGKPYSFPFYGNKYNGGYYNLNVLLSGKIEVEKIEVAEGDIP